MEKNERAKDEIAELQRQLAVLRTLTDKAPFGLYITDQETDEIVYCNLAFLNLWGIGHLQGSLAAGQLRNSDIVSHQLKLVSEPPAFLEKAVRRSEANPAGVAQLVIRLADGRALNFTTSAVHGERGQPTSRRVFVFEDITRTVKAEEDLRKSQERYKELADLLPQIIFEMDTDWNLTFVNQNGIKTIGFTEEELAGRLDALSIVAPEDREKAQLCLRRVLNGEKSGQEYTCLRRDGSRFAAIIHSSVIYREGKPAGIRGIIVDITERKREEEKLLLMQASIDNFHDPCTWADESGRFLYVNDAACKAFGYSREELLRLKITDIDVAYQGDNFEQVFSEIKGEGGAHLESRIRAKDGREFPVEVSAKAYRYRNKLWVVSFLRDVTELRLSEKRLAENLQFLQTMIDSIPTPLFYKDSRGVYVGCNAQFEKYLGKSREQIIGKSVYDTSPAEFAQIYHQADLDLIHSGDFQTYESKVLHADGSAHDVIFYKAPFRDADGKISGLIGTILDITDRKLAEEQLKSSLREKEVLLKEVHHRVKNNMQIISSLLNLQLSGSDQEPIRQILTESQNRIRSIALVHERIYKSDDLARIDFKEYVKSLSKQLLHTYVADPERVRLTVDGDCVQIGVDQAVPCGLIMNELISNCLKHAFPGSRQGTIRIHLRSGEKNTIVIEDDGVGLPESFSLKEAQSMGMQLVTALVDQLEGTITPEGERGTRITLEFPPK